MSAPEAYEHRECCGLLVFLSCSLLFTTSTKHHGSRWCGWSDLSLLFTSICHGTWNLKPKFKCCGGCHRSWNGFYTWNRRKNVYEKLMKTPSNPQFSPFGPSKCREKTLINTKFLNSKVCFGGPRSYWNTPKITWFIKKPSRLWHFRRPPPPPLVVKAY